MLFLIHVGVSGPLYKWLSSYLSNVWCWRATHPYQQTSLLEFHRAQSYAPCFLSLQVLPAFGFLFFCLVWMGLPLVLASGYLVFSLMYVVYLSLNLVKENTKKKSRSQTKEHSHSSGSEASVCTYKIVY